MKRIRRYLYKRGKIYYYMQRINGRQKWVSLRTSDSKTARELADEILRKAVLSGVGIGAPPKVQRAYSTLAGVIDFYVNSGCPRRDSTKRTSKSLGEETRKTDALKRHLGTINPNELRISDWQRYVYKRQDDFGPGKGERTIDMEWTVLSSVYRWAIRHQDETGVTSKPLQERPTRVQRSSTVRHCREFQPESAEELHRIAGYFMPLPESKLFTSTVFGWQTLLSAMIGQRCSEILKLRTDATKPSEAGFDDGDHLWLYRSRTHKGTAPFIKIGPELREALDAHACWKRQIHPGSPWFFPSPSKPSQTIQTCSFGHALTRACKKLDLSTRTPHGLRSYYVNVLRSQGIPDHEIALRIGHKSGGKLIVDTYGEILPIKLGWMPAGRPAWDAWRDAKPITKLASIAV